MKLKPKKSISDYFNVIKDFRVEGRIDHKLIDVITIGICSVICGGRTWESMEIYGLAKEKWLRSFLELPNGIPSHDTFARIFAGINAEDFQKCFREWVRSIAKATDEEIIAIDGKQARNSKDIKNGQRAINMVSAFATENKLVLGQKAVQGKSNEITAIPELIKVLEIAGCIVTIDAMGCQKEIVKTIVEKQGDYVIALKLNQGSLHKQVEKLFKQAISTRDRELQTSEYSTKEANHGREEIRNYLMISNISSIIDPENKWLNLKSVGMVESIRTVGNKTTAEIRYFITSLVDNAQLFAKCVRNHWMIENCLHWVLDVQMGEDSSRIRKDNAPANFIVLRHIAINLLRENKSNKYGTNGKQFLASIDNEYLTEILNSIL
jgi:predicted transposase YbfD/YdcC